MSQGARSVAGRFRGTLGWWVRGEGGVLCVATAGLGGKTETSDGIRQALTKRERRKHNNKTGQFQLHCWSNSIKLIITRNYLRHNNDCRCNTTAGISGCAWLKQQL